jgi:hypothetical protein
LVEALGKRKAEAPALVGNSKKQNKKHQKGSENRYEKGGEEQRNKVYSSSPKKPHKKVETSQDY